LAGKIEVLGGNLPQCRFVHHKPTWPVRKPTRAATNLLSYGTALSSCNTSGLHSRGDWFEFPYRRSLFLLKFSLFSSAFSDKFRLSTMKGRAIAQAVSRRLPTAAARVCVRRGMCDLWWTKVALGQVFSENFGFPCQFTFHLFLHNRLHYHPRLAQ
jgi:hypothetical protein